MAETDSQNWLQNFIDRFERARELPVEGVLGAVVHVLHGVVGHRAVPAAPVLQEIQLLAAELVATVGVVVIGTSGEVL
jgi:hypothetical protein